MKKVLLFALAAALLCAAAFAVKTYNFPSEAAALRRVQTFAGLVDYHYGQPEKIYAYLTEEYRESIDREDFIVAFEKERSYPYLTPFFINFLSLRMAADNRSGIAVFSQAARLPGMVYEMPFVYENGNYYMLMSEYAGFPDGSYLDKFNSIPKYLTEGWD